MTRVTRAIAIINLCLGVLTVVGSALFLHAAFWPKAPASLAPFEDVLAMMRESRQSMFSAMIGVAPSEARKAELRKELAEMEEDDMEWEAETERGAQSLLLRMRIGGTVWAVAAGCLLAAGVVLLRGVRWARTISLMALVFVPVAACAGFALVGWLWTPWVDLASGLSHTLFSAYRMPIGIGGVVISTVYPIVAIILLWRVRTPQGPSLPAVKQIGPGGPGVR